MHALFYLKLSQPLNVRSHFKEILQEWMSTEGYFITAKANQVGALIMANVIGQPFKKNYSYVVSWKQWEQGVRSLTNHIS